MAGLFKNLLGTTNSSFKIGAIGAAANFTAAGLTANRTFIIPNSGGTLLLQSRNINTTAPITGGGDLSADRAIAISAATTGTAGSMSAADKTKLDSVDSGTWTPSAANVANAGSFTIQTFHYIRVKNEVSFSGTVSLTPTAGATNTQFTLTLPIASTLGSSLNDLSGTATTQQTIGGGGGFVRSDAAGKMLVQFTSGGASPTTFRISGHYIIN